MKFTASADGFLTGLWFYKSTANTGTHVANLWSSTGALLATATFMNEGSSGWQHVTFATPVAVTAGATLCGLLSHQCRPLLSDSQLLCLSVQ